VNEAGLTSARSVPAEGEAILAVSLPLEEVSRGHVRAQPYLGGRLPAAVKVGVTLGATGVGFAVSLASLPAGFPDRLTLGALGLVPLISLLLAVAIAVGRRGPEPDIHDRYLDYILGLALLGAAAAAMWFLPGSMSIFFWSWRLDMVWLPVFAAGAITLVCGARALWRYRVPVAFLFLAWPLPYVAARVPAALSAVAIAGLGLILLVLASFGRGGRTDWGSARRQTGGGLIAVGLVCVAAIVTSVADRQLQTAAPLLQADGQPKLAAISRPATSIDGLLRTAATDPATTLPDWGSRANHQRYRYSSAQATLPGTGDATMAGIVVDVLAPSEGRDLALSPSGLATLQGYRLEASRLDDIGAGLAGHVERYRAPGGGTSLLVVWWDWPVRSSAGVQRERIIVDRLVPIGFQVTRGEELLQFARHLVASMVREAATS
jgi:hypothetical protein